MLITLFSFVTKKYPLNLIIFNTFSLPLLPHYIKQLIIDIDLHSMKYYCYTETENTNSQSSIPQQIVSETQTPKNAHSKPFLILIFGIIFAVVFIILGNLWGSGLLSRRDKNLLKYTTGSSTGHANNAARTQDVKTLSEALHLYVQETGQILPVITTTVRKISKSEADLCQYITPKYIATLPRDPAVKLDNNRYGGNITDCSSNYETGFTVIRNPDNTITIAAPNAENGETISETR